MRLNNNSVFEVLSEGKKILKLKGVEQYSLDAELFLMKVLGFTKVQLFTKDRETVSELKLKEFEEMLQKRCDGVPTQYILGVCEFMGLDFQVNPHVLIPRPDTEVLVERVLEIAKNKGYKNFMDMCTGSGCIAVSLAVHGGLMGSAVDISMEALNTAKTNAAKNSVADKIEFFQSNLFEDLNDSFKYDIIVSNPPYIERDVVKTLMKEVKDNEPEIALDGGIDGLDFYKIITNKALDFLKPKALLAFEIGYNQGLAVKKMLEDNGFENVKIENDLSGLNRVVYGFNR